MVFCMFSFADEMALEYISIDSETGQLSLIQKLDDSITTDLIFLVEVSSDCASVIDIKMLLLMFNDSQAGEGIREGSASLIVFLPGNGECNSN